jgi:hypothetical protein
MKCKNCLIWQRRDAHLRELNRDFIPGLARLFPQSKIEELRSLIIKEAKHLDALWRQSIHLMDNECPQGRCVLPVL